MKRQNESGNVCGGIVASLTQISPWRQQTVKELELGALLNCGTCCCNTCSTVQAPLYCV